MDYRKLFSVGFYWYYVKTISISTLINYTYSGKREMLKMGLLMALCYIEHGSFCHNYHIWQKQEKKNSAHYTTHHTDITKYVIFYEEVSMFSIRNAETERN